MMDDIEEQNVIAQEISDALSTPFGMNQELDDVNINFYYLHNYMYYAKFISLITCILRMSY